MANQPPIITRWNIRGKDDTRRAALSANKNMQAIGKSAKATSATLNLMAIRLAAVAAGYVALRHSIAGVNTVQNLNNRLNLVANKNLEETKQKLFDVARESFASFDSTSQFYAKLALSSKELGRSQADLLKVVEITNKAVAISGSSAESAAGGLIQFSQGIASNRLAGDELRSVLENLPGLADAIARGIGTTRGELRDLAAAGKLTATAVIDGLLSQEEEVNEYFDRFNATISIAAQQFGNSFIRAIDKVEVHSGAFKRVGVEVLEMADAFTAATDELVDYLDEVGGVEGAMHDLRVEIDLLKGATAAYFVYLAGGAVISAGQALIDLLRRIATQGLAARGALIIPFAALAAGYYTSAKGITYFADQMLEQAEAAEVARRRIADLTAEAVILQDRLDSNDSRFTYIKLTDDELEGVQNRLEVINGLIQTQQGLLNAQIGPPAPPKTAPKAAEDDGAVTSTEPTTDPAITATETRNRKLGELRHENLLAEMAADKRAGEFGIAELARQIEARRKAETEALAQRIAEAGKFAEFEAAQRDARIQLLVDDRSRELAQEYAAYDDRLAIIMQEVSDTERRDELLQEELRIHRERLLAINAEYDERDKERKAQLLTNSESYWGALTGKEGAYYGQAAKYKEGDAKHAEEKENFKQKVLADGVNALAKHSKAAFKLVKAAKIAQAVVDTYSGINRALGEYPPPTSFVLAAAVAAAGFANVASIASSQFGGGSAASGNTGSGGGGTAATPATSTAQTPVIQEAQQAQGNITINIGNGVFGREAVTDLIGELNEAIGDGVELKVGVR